MATAPSPIVARLDSRQQQPAAAPEPGSGVAVGQVNQSPINVGSGNSGLQTYPWPRQHDPGRRRGATANWRHCRQSNGANSSANSGSISSGNSVAGDTNTSHRQLPTRSLVQSVQTVALTQLKQVNCRCLRRQRQQPVRQRCHPYRQQLQFDLQRRDIATLRQRASLANSAAQNMVNVSANINHP